jgi:hypothetical protein
VKFTPVPHFGHATSVLCVYLHAKCAILVPSISADIGWQKSSDFQVSSTNLSEGFGAEGWMLLICSFQHHQYHCQYHEDNARQQGIISD